MRFFRFTVWFMIGLLVAYAGIFFRVRQQIFAGYPDFIMLYTGAKVLQRGEASRLYDLPLQYQIQQDAVGQLPTRNGPLPFVRPAFEAWLFRPLAGLSYAQAFIFWSVVSGAILALTPVLLRREIPALQRYSPALILLAMASYFPVFACLLQGQDSILLLLIYTLCFMALRRGAHFRAGLVLSLGLIKFILVLPFALAYLLRGKFRFAGGFAAGSLALAAVSITTTGWKTFLYYWSFLLHIDRLAPGVNVPHNMPNLRGLLSMILSGLPPGAAMIILAAFSLLLLGWATRHGFPQSREWGLASALGFSLNLVVTVLVSYHAHVFDLTLLLLPAAVAVGALVSGETLPSRPRKMLLWSLVCLGFSPLYSVLFLKTGYEAVLAIIGLVFLWAISAVLQAMQENTLPAAEGNV